MKIHSMSDNELQIALLKDINSIYVYDLLVPSFDPEKRTFFGLAVFCANQRPLNYCEFDKEFEKYKLKVLNQYMLEKDKRKIKMNSNTRKFIEEALKIEKKKVPEGIESTISKEESLVKDGHRRFKKFENVLQYNLELLLKYLGKNISISEAKGFKNNLKIGDKLGVVIKNASEFSVEFELLGLLDTIEYVNVKMSINSNSIKFYLESSDESIIMYSSFENKENGIEKVINITSNGIIEYYDSGIYEEDLTEHGKAMTETILNNGLHQNEYRNIYKLPWNGYFTNDISASKEEYCYVEFRDDYILFTSFDEKTFNGEYGYRLKTSGGREKTEIFKVEDKNIGVIETHYSDVPNALGIYKDRFNGNYYYSIGRFDDFKNPRHLIVEPINENIELGFELFELGKRLVK